MATTRVRAASSDIDQRILKEARRNDGLVVHRRLLDRGINPKVIVHRRRSGLLVPVVPGVSCLAGVERTPVRRALAVTLTHPNTWMSHTVCRGGPEGGDPEAARPCRRHRRRCGLRDPDRRRAIPPQHRAADGCRPHGLPRRLDQWRRVVLDRARVGPPGAGARARRRLHGPLRMLSLPRLHRLLLARDHRTRGRTALLELVSDRLHGAGITRSWLEGPAMQVLADAGCPGRSATTRSVSAPASGASSTLRGRVSGLPSRPTAGPTTPLLMTGVAHGSGTVSSPRPTG